MFFFIEVWHDNHGHWTKNKFDVPEKQDCWFVPERFLPYRKGVVLPKRNKIFYLTTGRKCEDLKSLKNECNSTLLAHFYRLHCHVSCEQEPSQWMWEWCSSTGFVASLTCFLLLNFFTITYYNSVNLLVHNHIKINIYFTKYYFTNSIIRLGLGLDHPLITNVSCK